jgi:hypothetical protein
MIVANKASKVIDRDHDGNGKSILGGQLKTLRDNL